MSTRANIIIKNSKYNEKLWFYRHSDGYPEGAMPTLQKFMAWLRDGKIRDNVVQSAGWLILIGAEEYGYEWDNTKKVTKQSITTLKDWKCGAYEPTTGRHGDIEFLYVIDLDTKELTCYDAHCAPYDDKTVRPDDIWTEDKKVFVDTKDHPWTPKEETVEA